MIYDKEELISAAGAFKRPPVFRPAMLSKLLFKPAAGACSMNVENPTFAEPSNSEHYPGDQEGGNEYEVGDRDEDCEQRETPAHAQAG